MRRILDLALTSPQMFIPNNISITCLFHHFDLKLPNGSWSLLCGCTIAVVYRPIYTRHKRLTDPFVHHSACHRRAYYDRWNGAVPEKTAGAVPSLLSKVLEKTMKKTLHRPLKTTEVPRNVSVRQYEIISICITFPITLPAAVLPATCYLHAAYYSHYYGRGGGALP